MCCKNGSDMPNMRYLLIIAEVGEVFAGSDFALFSSLVDKGGVVRAIPAPGAASRPRSFFDKLNDWARGEGAPGLGYIVFGEGGEAKGPIAKFLDAPRLETLRQTAGVRPVDAGFV